MYVLWKTLHHVLKPPTLSYKCSAQYHCWSSDLHTRSGPPQLHWAHHLVSWFIFAETQQLVPQQKSNDWGTLSPAVLGKPSYQQPSTMLRSWTYDWQAFLVEAKPGKHSGWYTQPQWRHGQAFRVFQSDRTEGWGMVFGGLRHWDVVTWQRYTLFVPSFCMEIFGPAKPRHGHLNRTSCCFEIAVSANQTTPGNFWPKRKLWDLSKIAFQFPNFSCWMQMNFIQQNDDQDKIAGMWNRNSWLQALLGDHLLFLPRHSCLRKHIIPISVPFESKQTTPKSLLLGSGTRKTFGQQVYPTCQPFSWKLAILATSAKEIHVPEARPILPIQQPQILFHLSYLTRHHPIGSSQALNLGRSRGLSPSVLPSHLPRKDQQVLWHPQLLVERFRAGAE